MKNTQQLDAGGVAGEIYYTIKEVCELLTWSKATLWRQCKFNGLKKVKVGGIVRIRKSSLDQWLSDHES